MRYVSVQLDRSSEDKPVVQVLPWEVPVLQFIYGPDRVVEVGSADIARRDRNGKPRGMPDAVGEFARLEAKYGRDTDSERSVASLVFGPAPAGVQAVGRMIDAERGAPAVPPGESEDAPEPEGAATPLDF